MSSMNDMEAGQLIAAVNRLSKDVEKLTERIEDLDGQLNKGKGLVVGVFLAAGGLGAAASSVLAKWLGG